MKHDRHTRATAHISCSTHASVRMQQRCVPRSVVNLLLAYGEEARTANGFICYFNKRSRQCMKRNLPPAASSKIDRYWNCYLVENDDGKLITVGYRYKRIRHRS